VFTGARAHRGADDAGLSLLEVVVALSVFAIGVTAILGFLVNTDDVVGDNIRRTAATNLVNQTLEAARAQTALAITNGRVVTTKPVSGTTYTITQEASFLTSDSTANVCQGSGSSLAYKHVRVAVTWPNMGNVQPVTGDVLRAIGVGTPDGLDSTVGTVAVQINGGTGLPVGGVTVALSGTSASQVTGSDGCAVFAGLTPQAYTVTASQSGYVGSTNTSTASAVVSPAAGTVARGTLLFDTERTLNFVFDGPSGALVPVGMPIRIGGTYVAEATVGTCTGSDVQACVTAIPGAIQHLFPDSYTVKAGSCIETDQSAGLIDIRRAAANNSTVTVPMAAVTVKVTKSSGVTASARTASFIHAAQSTGCTSGETYSTPNVSAGTTVLLPYGTWTVSVPGFSLLGVPLANSTQTITVGPSAKTASVTLVVTN
jgi:prepilin-type N-terminal cleavage/methylation domain-containing protein